MSVWSALFQFLPPDGNAIGAGRAEIAATAGCTPADVSRVMRELERIGAVSCRRQGRRVAYEVNPSVGTHLAGAARDKAQAEAPRLQLVE
jgi:predicted transcriptional regulator